MGWTWMHRERGISDRAFWQGELSDRYRIVDCATVGGAFSGTFYAAVETTEGKDKGQVWALVCLTHWAPGDYHNYGYKDMDERMGPAEASCPARILDLLSPVPECSHAGTWCTYCDARIWEFGGQWVSVARPGQAAGVGGPRCYSGYRRPDGWTGQDRPFHEPGGQPLLCGNCSSRDWRERCRAVAANRARAARVRPGQVVKFARPIKFKSGAELDTLTFEKRDVFTADGMRYRVTGWRTTAGWELAA